ncbi:Asp/Glu/Hydantoin racemase-domain-containing protein [Dipodascopsis uninucleata]
MKPEYIKTISSLRDLKKIGFIVPSSNTALEPITVAMTKTIADKVSFHFNRVTVRILDTDENSQDQFNPTKMVMSGESLNDADIDALLWNGTSGAWSGAGIQQDTELAKAIEAATGLPCSTSTLAQVEVLEKYGIKRIAVTGPYVDGPTQGLVKFYTGLGYEVVKTSQMNVRDNVEFGNTPIERIKELIREADCPEAECIIVACTNWPAALVLDELEAELGKPIYDSIAVTLWKALQMANIDVPIFGWGILLRDDPVLAKLNAVLEKLLSTTNASRTTLRLDLQSKNCDSDMVCAEACAPGIPPLKLNPSLNQRALRTVQWLEDTHKVLVQSDCVNAPVQPPKALMGIYGVRAQMLSPIIKDDEVLAWISVHHVGSVREWKQEEIEAIKAATVECDTILKQAGWI